MLYEVITSVIFGMHGLGVASEGIRSVIYAVVCLGTCSDHFFSFFGGHDITDTGKIIAEI